MTETPLALGIDFGTSKTLAAIYEGGKAIAVPDPGAPREVEAPWTPSIVSQWSEGGEAQAANLVVGWEARDYLTAPQTVRYVKRWLNNPRERFTLCGQEYSPLEVAAMLLMHVRANTERLFRRPIREVVLSIPANFGGVARESLVAAAKMAGLVPLRLVNEPTAAALAYTMEHPETSETLLVFDFGGGTLDITILRKSGRSIYVHSTHGDPQLGGSDFDHALQAMLLKRLHERHGQIEEAEDLPGNLLREAEYVKWKLSERPSVNAALGYVGRKGGKNIYFNLTITRDDLLEVARPLFGRVRACIAEALARGGLRPEAIDRVLLIGGTVKIPAVREMVEEMLGDKCFVHDPLTAVAEGATLLAAQQLGLVNGQRSLVIADVAGYGLGIKYKKMSDPDGPSWYGCLIAPNQEIPYSVTRSEFFMPRADQTRMTLALYEGYTKEDCLLDPSFALVRESSIDNIPASDDGRPRRVEIEFRYTENAIVELKASIAGTGKTLPLVYDPRVSEQDIEKSANRVRGLLKLPEPPPPPAPTPSTPPPPSPPFAEDSRGPEPVQSGATDTTQGTDVRDDGADGGLLELIGRLQECLGGRKARMYPRLRESAKRLLEEAAVVRRSGSDAEKERLRQQLEKMVSMLRD